MLLLRVFWRKRTQGGMGTGIYSAKFWRKPTIHQAPAPIGYNRMSGYAESTILIIFSSARQMNKRLFSLGNLHDPAQYHVETNPYKSRNFP